MTLGYGTLIRETKDKLLAVIKSTTTFADKTSADYITQQNLTKNPFATLRLRSDTLSAIGPVETRHLIQFEIWIYYIGDTTESSLNAIISYVGEIVDAIESDRSLGSNYIQNTEIRTVDYTMSPSGPQAVRHTARILVAIEAFRNI